MAFTYTNAFGQNSPLHGGSPVNSVVGGDWTNSGAASAALISTGQASTYVAMMGQRENAGVSGLTWTVSGGLIGVSLSGSARGYWLAFGG